MLEGSSLQGAVLPDSCMGIRTQVDQALLTVPALPQPGPYRVRLDRLREARVAALTPYRLRNALAITVAFVLAGCFADSAIGPCTLQIKANEQGHRLLEPPYRVRLGPGSDPTVLYVSGTGWMQANIVFRHSSGYENSWQLTQQDITGNTTGFPVNRAGQWQVRMSDPVTGCVQEFAVEVVE